MKLKKANGFINIGSLASDAFSCKGILIIKSYLMHVTLNDTCNQLRVPSYGQLFSIIFSANPNL